MHVPRFPVTFSRVSGENWSLRLNPTRDCVKLKHLGSKPSGRGTPQSQTEDTFHRPALRFRLGKAQPQSSCGAQERCIEALYIAALQVAAANIAARTECLAPSPVQLPPYGNLQCNLVEDKLASRPPARPMRSRLARQTEPRLIVHLEQRREAYPHGHNRHCGKTPRCGYRNHHSGRNSVYAWMHSTNSGGLARIFLCFSSASLNVF